MNKPELPELMATDDKQDDINRIMHDVVLARPTPWSNKAWRRQGQFLQEALASQPTNGEVIPLRQAMQLGAAAIWKQMANWEGDWDEARHTFYNRANIKIPPVDSLPL